MDWLIKTFGYTMREAWCIEQMVHVLGQVGKRGLIATFTIIAQLCSFCTSGTPITPYGDELDLTGYSLVFEDEFDGDALNWDVWRTRGEGSKTYFKLSKDQVSVHDGNLYITAQYKDETTGKYGAGWYSGDIKLRKQYTYGYFEVRAICNNDAAFNSAFWLQSDHCYDSKYSLGGPGGAEIDILENLMYYYGYSAAKNTIHVAGIDGPDDTGTDTYHMPPFYTENDMFTEYNTYGVMWTEDEYIFYHNGVETVRTSFGNGVCEVPCSVILSFAGPNTSKSWQVAGFKKLPKDRTPTFTIDYVRIYQLDKDTAEEIANK